MGGTSTPGTRTEQSISLSMESNELIPEPRNKASCTLPCSHTGSFPKASNQKENLRFGTSGTRSILLFINSKKEESVACAYTHTRAYRENGSKLFSCSEPFYMGGIYA